MLEISIARRFGKPQVFAGLLLLMFLAQCIWLLVRMPVAGIVDNPGLLRAVGEGTRQLHGGAIAGNGDSLHSPLWYLTLAVLVAVTGPPGGSAWFAWAVAAPQIAFGMLLGASLWYVSRRLCGNEGGYVALALYCFSPGILRSSALWFTEPEMGAAWGAFGTVFTAIALAHTLYAPREVVLWNWRRILLLGLSFALAIGCQFSLAVLIVAALGLLLYLAWERRAAALAIWLAACGIALLLISASYFFRNDAFRQSLQDAFFFGLRWRPYISSLAYGAFISRLEEISPA